MSDAGADRCIARCKPAKAVYTSGWYESNNGLSNGKRYFVPQLNRPRKDLMDIPRRGNVASISILP